MTAVKTWYVQAIGHTNEVIANELPTENAHKSLMCKDGLRHDLWECDYRFITKLSRCEQSAQLCFEVFYREGPHGPIKPWPFLRRRRRSLRQALDKGLVKSGNALTVARKTG
jgi:hypothetical protein